MVYFMENPKIIWMSHRGSPILGNLMKPPCGEEMETHEKNVETCGNNGRNMRNRDVEQTGLDSSNQNCKGRGKQDPSFTHPLTVVVFDL